MKHIFALQLVLATIIQFVFLPKAAAQVFTESNLPVISIHTNGKAIQDEPKIEANMSVRYKGPGQVNKLSDQPTHFDGKIGIEFRGSSSQNFPKKPYGFETRDEDGENLNVSLIGMPEENDWTLNATYNDKSLVRDALAYILAGEIMTYAPRVRHVELIINDAYQGVYMLIEKIKRDGNRVDISKLESDDNSGDAITGGYILKIDKESGSNSGEGWFSPYAPFPGAWQKTLFQIEYPDVDDITEQQKSYIKQHITSLEAVLAGSDFDHPENGYRKWMDEQSIIDFIIMNELTKNPDAYRLSTFLYKHKDSKGGKIYFGPVWDFNLGFGNVDYCTQGDPKGLVIEKFNQVCPDDYWVTHFWWKKFMEDQHLKEALQSRWRQLRAGKLDLQTIHFKIDSMAMILDNPQKRNFVKWPVLGQYVWPNYYVGPTYNSEIVYLKNWVKERLGYLDSVWGSPVSVSQVESHSVNVRPVPADHLLWIKMSGQSTEPVSMEAKDVFGRRVFVTSHVNFGEQAFGMDISRLSPGLYFLDISIGSTAVTKKFVVQH